MTDDQINAAIAEACGWTQVGECENGGFRLRGFPPNRSEAHRKPIPQFCTDLNAMHEAEKTLTDDKYHQFTDCLYDLEQHRLNQTNKWRWLSVTAHQRAEAFLRTLGKWEDAKL
jgi:hypothetical protein